MPLIATRGDAKQLVGTGGQYVYDWSVRGIRWREILRYQHLGAVLLFVPAVVLTAIAHFTFQDWPVQRQALIYDASISYPRAAQETIPNSQAVAFNWICFIVALAVVEFIIFHRHHSLTTALAGFIHHVWCCLVNFLIVVAITEITKPFSGRLRPDFLTLCNPPSLSTPSSDVVTPISGHATSLGNFTLGETVTECSNPDQEVVRDGRLSFPSGHASTSMSLAWYTSLYLMWSLYLRLDAPYPRRLYWKTSIWQRLMGEVLHAVAYGFLLLTLCLSWFIGATRFWDNKHNISDIIGGFLLAIIFTTPYFIKALGLHTAMRELIDREPEAKAGVTNSMTGASPAGPTDLESGSVLSEGSRYSAIGYGNSMPGSPGVPVMHRPADGQVVLNMDSNVPQRQR